MFDCHSFITHATLKRLGEHSLSSKSYFVLLCWLISNYRFSISFLRRFQNATNLMEYYDKVALDHAPDYLPSDLSDECMEGWVNNPLDDNSIFTPRHSAGEEPPEAIQKIIDLLTELQENCSDDLEIVILRDRATIQFSDGSQFVYCFYSDSPKLIERN